MEKDERAVATAHFQGPATVEAIATARRWVAAFASEHGMTGARKAEMATAVSEAVTNAVRHAYPASELGDVVVDAATDGEWLTVRIADDGCGQPGESLGLGVSLMTELSDRIELGPGPRGVGTVVLMEFEVGRPAPQPEAERGPRIVRTRRVSRGPGPVLRLS